MRKIVIFLFPFLLLHGLVFPQTTKVEPSAERRKLVSYLKSHRKSPEDYVVGKFKKYDIVFIGELHRVKHDVELIHNLIPRLYKAGIYNLGIEFGRYQDQEIVDRLITADTYDENLARWLVFKSFVGWGFKEYEDIYRKAWELNHSLPKKARRFRVVAFGPKVDWTQLQANMTDEQWDKVWYDGEPDEKMAAAILKEFVAKRQKALIYSGSHHAFTRYRQPSYDYQNKKFIGLRTPRMGNIVYAKMPDKVFNIFLHSPWQSGESPDAMDYPIGGVIDEVLRDFTNKRVGFDVRKSPFGKLKDNKSYYSIGHPDFTLADFTDGYIFQKQFSDYEGVTVDELFVTKDNFEEAVNNYPNFDVRKFKTKPEVFLEGMRRDADFRRIYKHLK